MSSSPVMYLASDIPIVSAVFAALDERQSSGTALALASQTFFL